MSTHPLLTTEDGLTVASCSSLWNSLNSVGLSSAISANGLKADELRDRVDFPGVIVQRAEMILGVVGCSPEPDGTVSATLPILTPHTSWNDHIPVVQALYRGVEYIARAQGARGIHCLVPVTEASSGSARPEQDEFCTTRLMQQSGLEQVAVVLRLEKRLYSDDLPTHKMPECSWHVQVVSMGEQSGGQGTGASTDQTLETLFTDSGSIGSASAALEVILDEVLKHSNDLPVSIRPSGARLLQTWAQRRARLFCISDAGELVGIAAVSGLSQETPAESSGSETAITLEYIGVRPAHRRKGIGDMLLHIAEAEIIRERCLAEGNSVVLTAYADAANSAAMALYQKNGYQQSEQYRLLYRILPEAD